MNRQASDILSDEEREMKILFAIFLFFLPSANSQKGGLEEAIRLYEKGEYKLAATRLSELTRSSPEDPNIRHWMGKAFIKTRQWDKAVREMEKATQIEPSNALYRLWLGRACGYEAEHTFKLFAMGKARRVIKEFEAASKLAPANIDIRFDMLEFYIQAPSMIGGGDDKAKAEALTIAKLDPKHGPIARVVLFKNDKKFDLAKKELIQATVDYPDYPAAYADLADFLLDQNDFDGALKNSQKALALKESKHAKLIMAAARIRLGSETDEAERSLKELASGLLGDNDPSFEQVYYWLGECYLLKGDKAKARQSLQSALSYDPDYEPAKKTMSKLR
jgi:tetratricopeptide (TPR) repeat protein